MKIPKTIAEAFRMTELRLVAPIVLLTCLALPSPASAAPTYQPTLPVAGEPLTITDSVDWEGCTAASWNVTKLITLIAPDGTETEFTTISETGTSAAPAQTFTGSDTQTLPSTAGDFAIRTTIRSFCGRAGHASTGPGSIPVAKDATVPAVDPLIGSAAVAITGLGYGFRRRSATRNVSGEQR